MFVQIPLWGFIVLLIFASIGALAVGAMIYFEARKGDDK